MSIFKDILATLRGGTVVTAPAVVVTAEKALLAAADYAAEDVLDATATTGSPWRWNNVARKPDGFATITKAIALCSTTALTPGITVYLFNAPPTSAVLDNGANTAVITADRYKYVGQIAFPAMADLGGNSESIATPSTSGNLPLRVKTDPAGGLWGIVVTRDAITGEAAGMGLMISFLAEQD